MSRAVWSSISCIFLIASSAILYYATKAPINSPDMFWHLKLGDDLVFRHLSPFVDRYSFEYLGRHLKFVPWMFDGLTALFFHFFGQGAGLQLFRGICWILANLVFFVFLRADGIALSLQVLGFIFLDGAMIFHPEVRPEIVSYIFILVFFLFLRKARKNPNDLNLLTLMLVLLFWVNFHTSCVFGFVMGAALYAELILRNIRNRGAVIRYVLFGAATFAVGFLNKDLSHPILAQLNFDDWGRFVVEYQKGDYSRVPVLFTAFAVLAFLTCLLTLAERKVAETIILSVLFFGSLRMVRLLHLFVFVGIPFVIQNLNDVKNWLDGKVRSKVALAFPIAICVLGFFSASDLYHYFKINNGSLDSGNFIPSYYPEDVVNYMKTKKYGGNVINQFAQGSYILWAAGPDLKVFLDGRTYILYPFSHLEKYVDAITHPKKLIEVANADSVDYVIAPITEAHALMDSAASSGIFFLEFVGRENALLSRRFDKFNRWTLPFIHPECLTHADWRALPEEYAASQRLSPESPLTVFFATAMDYEQAKDKRTYLRAADNAHFDQVDRFLGQMAAESHLPERALYFFDGMRAFSPADHIRIAELLCEADDCRGAENELSKLTYPRAQDIDFKKGYDTLLKVKAKVPLSALGESLLERWKPFSHLEGAADLCSGGINDRKNKAGGRG